MGYQIFDGLTDAQIKILNIIESLHSASPKQLDEHPDIRIGKVMLHRQ